MKKSKNILMIAIAFLALGIPACSRSNNETATTGASEANTTSPVANSAQNALANNSSAQPNPSEVSLATPSETLKAFVSAIRVRDENTLRRTLSQDSLRNAEEILAMPTIKEEGITNLVDLIGGPPENGDMEFIELEIVPNSEKIVGNKATLEARPANTNLNPTKVDFVKEGNEWKLDSSAESEEALAALKEAEKEERDKKTVDK